MMITAINGNDNNYRVRNFCAKTMVRRNNNISKNVVDKLGLRLQSQVGYSGPPEYVPAPNSIGENLANYMHELKVNWASHVEPGQKSKNSY